MNRLLKGLLPLLILLANSALSSPELYGSIQYDFQNESKSAIDHSKYQIDYSEAQQTPSQAHSSKRASKLRQQESHIGIKGEKEIGNGNAIIYQLEWGDEK